MPAPYNFSAPRDGKTPAIERLEWLTDVQVSRNGTEARRGLRAFPRHTYSYDLHATSDISRACLQALRSETSFLVPLWPHVFERPAMSPDAGIAASSPRVMQLGSAGAQEVSGAPISWGSGYSVAAPAAVARFASNQRSFSHIVSGRVATSAVSFRLENFHEAVAAYGGAASVSMPSMFLLDGFTGAGGALAEQVQDDANNFDNGQIDLYESRYLQRVYTLSISLNTRTKILDFRRLLFSLRGRLNPVRWTAPGDAVERTWRLAADTVELSYIRPGLVNCTLSLKQLSAY